MNKYIKIPILIISLLMASLSFGQTQSFKIPIQGKTLNFNTNTGAYTDVTILPQPTSSEYPNYAPDFFYNGSAPLDVQQVVTNDKGELLFFVQDNLIYDSRGICGTPDSPSGGMGDYNDYIGAQEFYQEEDIKIRDLQIVPLDGECYKYMLIWHQVSPDGVGSSGVNNTISYMVIGVSENKLLEFYTISNLGIIDYANPDVMDSDCIQDIIVFGHVYDGDNPMGFAVSDILPNNERFLFVHSADEEFITYKFDKDGFDYAYSEDPIQESNYDFHEVGISSEICLYWEETELIKKGAYYYYAFANVGSQESNIAIHFLKINEDGHVEYSVKKDVGIVANQEYIKGLEFSENGDYLYFTQVGKTNPLQYVETSFLAIQTAVGDINSVTGINSDYEFSHLELARDGDMYLINGTQGTLTSISNTNDPINSTLGITTNIGGSGMSNLVVNSNYSTIFTTNNNELKNYALTKQIDGADYISHYVYIEQNITDCCTKHFAYDAQNTYTVTNGTVDSWSPSNNPFRTDGITDLYFGEDLVIEAGVELSITGLTLYFRDGRGIILNAGNVSTKGAKLTLDNSKCTAYDACNVSTEMWKGIRVKGAGSSYAQTPLDNTRHAQLIMTNNATIEYAYEGVYSGTITWENMLEGGIILATNSKFIDNRFGIKLYNYTPSNISKFEGCTFKTTDNLYDIKNTYVYKLVSLSHVNGVKFLGTTFTNTSNNTVKWKNGWGINASSGSFTVDEYSNQNSYFTNLFVAVGSFHNTSISVKNSTFNNCNSGVYAIGTDNAIMIAKNEFNTDYVMSANEDGVYSNYGVYIDASTGFDVTENTFFSGNAGVVVNNSQSIDGGVFQGDQNRVYKNNFYTINNSNQDATACLAHGENSNYLVNYGSPSNPAPGEQGLAYACNTFNGNDYNISVVGDNDGSNNANIDQSQGSASEPVGNVFNIRTSTDWDFYANYTDVEQYQYHHYDLNSHALESYVSATVVNAKSDKTNPDCPSIFGGGGIIVIGRTLTNLDDMSKLAKEKEEDIQLIKDAGYTELYLSKVENLTSENYQTTTEELLETSSYLSEEVLEIFMENSIDRPVPKLMVLAKNSPLPNKLKSRIDNLNIPDVLKWYLWQMQDGTNPLEKKKEEFNSLLANRDLLLDRTINVTVHADLIEKTDSLILYLEEKDDFYSDKKLITLYTAKQDYASIDAMLSKLATYQSDLNDTQAERLSDYIQIKSIQNMMRQDPANGKTICKGHIPMLQSIASSNTKEGNIAASMLTDIGLSNYKPMYQLPDNNRTATVTQPRVDYSNMSAQDLITVYPNPVNQILHVEYFSMSPRGNIEIYDLRGTLVKTKSFNQQFGFAKVNVNDLANGTYVLNLNGDKAHSTKFIVKH